MKFSTNEGAVAGVDQRGAVTVNGPGEAAISAWYLSRLVTARITSPFPDRIDPAVYARAPRANFIDDLVLAKLAELNIEPSPLSSDAEFIRRAFLDAAGILPTAEEVRAFLADTTPDKRVKLVDALLARPEFVDYWSYKWSDLLLVSSRSLPSNAMWSYYNWIRRNVEANTPWDRMAREILTASGNTLANGAANYFVLHKNPIALTENVSMTFMGFSITCARCHNHPLEKWTQKDYYQMANLFSRVGIKNGADRGDIIVYPARTGEINHPRFNVPLAPRPLDGPAMSLDAPGDRREAFVNWLVSPENPFFARSLVNRVWKNFMGRGLVEAVDDIRDANPAVERGAVRGGDPRLRRAPVRRQASGADDHDVDDLPAHLDAGRSQRRRPEVPLALHRAPSPGGSDPRRDQPGHGRGRGLSGLPGSPRHAAAGRRRRLVLSVRLWSPAASDGSRFGAPAGAEHHAGAARHQRRHDQPQAERVARSDSRAGHHERGKRGGDRADLPRGAEPVSVG